MGRVLTGRLRPSDACISPASGPYLGPSPSATASTCRCCTTSRAKVAFRACLCGLDAKGFCTMRRPFVPLTPHLGVQGSIEARTQYRKPRLSRRNYVASSGSDPPSAALRPPLSAASRTARSKDPSSDVCTPTTSPCLVDSLSRWLVSQTPFVSSSKTPVHCQSLRTLSGTCP